MYVKAIMPTTIWEARPLRSWVTVQMHIINHIWKYFELYSNISLQIKQTETVTFKVNNQSHCIRPRSESYNRIVKDPNIKYWQLSVVLYLVMDCIYASNINQQA